MKTKSTLPAGGALQKKSPYFSLYTVYVVDICACACAYERERKGECMCVCGCANVVLVEALWPPVSASRLGGSGLGGARSDTGRKKTKKTSPYLQHVRHQAVIQPCCHRVTLQAFNRIYTFCVMCKKKYVRKHGFNAKTLSSMRRSFTRQ